MSPTHAARAFTAIVTREFLRFVQQKERFFAALVRPLIWLVVFAAGFRATLGLSIIPPYQTYISYDVYVVPGLIGMIQIFNGMQSSLSMVYDREMGSMRVLLSTPLPRWFVLFSRMLAATFVSIVQIYAFVAIALALGTDVPLEGLLPMLPVLVLTGLTLSAIGMFLSSWIRQLENFAGIMNFVIFPMFFISSALYPLWRVKESSLWLFHACQWNPFTYIVEAIRFAMYGQVNAEALAVVAGTLAVFGAAAVAGYTPARGGPAAGRASSAR
ncbi:ABC-2 type transport system permease protein [Breoghania corrubedonensis]|uniref:Transport permease protein n=1 Tax=Breoghania corrubedonensis TaxID=665038 RepID=A0A2T5VE15_9HYPH|nr:ABC transporter permease [Breoghania corrubedonensis]PTW61995.1 ABC-2 type transport system permease protein [Breoghania corrubedonensis]